MENTRNYLRLSCFRSWFQLNGTLLDPQVQCIVLRRHVPVMAASNRTLRAKTSVTTDAAE